MEPFVVPTMVQVVPTVVHVARQTTKVPHMTSPLEKQLREQR